MDPEHQEVISDFIASLGPSRDTFQAKIFLLQEKLMKLQVVPPTDPFIITQEQCGGQQEEMVIG